jgi:adenosylcobinamide kinase/adenosylcobinamide-phosphate guanylyltransferase
MSPAAINSGRSGITLILGGARSGKSAYAEGLIEAAGGGIYLATAPAPDEVSDPEMSLRIAQHRARRGDLWKTKEETINLSSALRELENQKSPVLVDCLSLWVSNLMADSLDVESAVNELATELRQTSIPIVFVSLEVGLGIVPTNELARHYRDHVGRTNQEIAKLADSVFFIAAGLPLKLK